MTGATAITIDHKINNEQSKQPQSMMETATISNHNSHNQ